MYSLRVLIGSLDRLCLLWLARAITLVLVLRCSIENGFIGLNVNQFVLTPVFNIIIFSISVVSSYSAIKCLPTCVELSVQIILWNWSCPLGLFLPAIKNRIHFYPLFSFRRIFTDRDQLQNVGFSRSRCKETLLEGGSVNCNPDVFKRKWNRKLRSFLYNILCPSCHSI